MCEWADHRWTADRPAPLKQTHADPPALKVSPVAAVILSFHTFPS